MTPKEKAEKLVQRFIYRTTSYVYIEDAKQCALIAVDEMIDYLVSNLITGTLMTYWEEVKQEIEAL